MSASRWYPGPCEGENLPVFPSGGDVPQLPDRVAAGFGHLGSRRRRKETPLSPL